jgi:hypothetical protein
MNTCTDKTVADMVRDVPGKRVDAIRAKFGDRFYLSARPRKHRYLFLVGDRRFKERVLVSLRYSTEPYPKRDHE